MRYSALQAPFRIVLSSNILFLPILRCCLVAGVLCVLVWSYNRHFRHYAHVSILIGNVCYNNNINKSYRNLSYYRIRPYTITNYSLYMKVVVVCIHYMYLVLKQSKHLFHKYAHTKICVRCVDMLCMKLLYSLQMCINMK